MKNTFKLHLFLLLVAGALLAGCSKDSTTPENGKDDNKEQISSDNSLRNFSFQKASNPTLESSFFAYEGNENTLYVTLPQGTDLTKLVPSFVADANATVQVGTASVTSGSTAVDFSETTTITVIAQSGTKRFYTVLARCGNPKIDNMVYSFMIEHDIPGVSVSVSKDEEIVYSAGYGFANKEKKERTTPDHKFRLASMSKQHTAIAIMTLVERGELKLEDKVFGKDGVLYKAFGDNMSASWKNITIEHLLSHTSGVLTDCIFGSSTYGGKDINGRISLLLQNAKVEYTPGTVYSYNNTNFGILGKIVEEVSGKKFINFMKDEIYTPLGIKNIDGGNNETIKEGEVNYYGQGGKNPFGNDVEAGVAAGGVIASTPDLMKLMAHLDYGTKVPDIFKKETLDRMYSPLPGIKTTGDADWNRYALGWRVNYPEIDTWTTYHGGTLAGVCTIWARGTDNVNGVVLCNSRSYNKSIDDDMWFMLEDIQDLFR